MRLLFKCLLFIVAIQFTATTQTLLAQEIKAVVPGDFADPSIIRKGNEYYSVGTSSEWAPHFPIFKSTNLKTWKQTGYVFKQAPEWANASFWAPEYYYHNKTYFIYYTARRKKDGVSCIGVATSKYPDKDFKDHGIIIEHGKEAIDAFVFNDKGQLYITWKAYGLDGRPIEILGSKLSNNGLSLIGDSFTMMKDDKGIGLEGQSILKKDDYYYMFYSVGNCCGSKCDYNVRVARAKTFQGPYENHTKNPLLFENEWWKCSGHGTFVNSPDGKPYYIYHAYNKASNVFSGRQGMLAELIWTKKNEWPEFKELSPAPNQPSANNFKANFTPKTPAVDWQWDFRNSTPKVIQKTGFLHLSGTIKKENNAGIALTLRPKFLNYEMLTTVVNNNNALKGLVLYGDANAATGIGVKANQVHFWTIKDNKLTILNTATINNSYSPLQLKMIVKSDLTCHVYWRQKSTAWKELSAGDNAYSIDFLPQWDRSPRGGLNFKGNSTEEAQFSSFELNYFNK
ncbi:beta-xylosidase [Pedobacter ginsengisoli]|uniref:Beta-xylosidase n=1 Tax=Pedobacter ginsengisoli TaxID=363852 RepID=A0A2D1U7S4_9SPHI|nr:glycoside hydrolase family 43 protein [Pedobacter ginsengisoli]ATP57648.1 beta-xylosidase [Pedobacter ginsengisoli]